jgi:hypothetical protein
LQLLLPGEARRLRRKDFLPVAVYVFDGIATLEQIEEEA